MPTFEYRCADCGRELDVTAYAPLYDTLECDCGGKMRRVYSAPAVHWQGGKPSSEVKE